MGFILANLPLEELRDGQNTFTITPQQFQAIAEALSSINARLEALELSQGSSEGDVVANSVSAQVIQEGNKRVKVEQVAVSDPTASGTGLTFIDSLSQNAQGAITPHKRTVQNGTTTQKGVVSLDNSELTKDSIGSGGVACSTGHKHRLKLTSGGTSPQVLSADTAYTLEAGGKELVFKTPADSEDTKNTVGAGAVSIPSGSRLYVPFTLSNSGTPQSYTDKQETPNNKPMLYMDHDDIDGSWSVGFMGKGVPHYAFSEEGLRDYLLYLTDTHQLARSDASVGSTLKHVYLSNGQFKEAVNTCIFHPHTASIEYVYEHSEDALRIYNLEQNACNIVELNMTDSTYNHSYICHIRIDCPSMTEGASPDYIIEITLKNNTTKTSMNGQRAYITMNSEDPIYPLFGSDSTGSYSSNYRQIIDLPSMGSLTSHVLRVRGHTYICNRYR